MSPAVTGDHDDLKVRGWHVSVEPDIDDVAGAVAQQVLCAACAIDKLVVRAKISRARARPTGCWTAVVRRCVEDEEGATRMQQVASSIAGSPEIAH
jgi:hypothetical protein